MFIHHSVSRAIAGATLGIALTGTAAAQNVQVGSFVSGERPMYLEIDQLVEGQSYHIKFMNVPAGSTDQTLFYSTAYSPVDLTSEGMPGYLGPDQLYGGFLMVNGNDYYGSLPTGMSGKTFYVQGFAKTPTGRRLTSMVEAHPQSTSNGGGGGAVFPINLTTQEVLPDKHAGYDRVGGPVRVGLPFPKGTVLEKNGVPQLTIGGGPTSGQFSTLAKWSDGSVKWALCEYLKDITANTVDTSVLVDHGTGNFGGADLATTSGTVTTVNTGPLVFTIDSAKDDLFQSFQLSGREVFAVSAGNRPHLWDDTDTEWTWHKTAVRTRREGPVRAEVEVDGAFTRTNSITDNDRVYVRFYLEAFKNGTSVRATVSLRDTALSFPQNFEFRGFTWSATLNESGPFDVDGPTAVKNGGAGSTVSGSIGNGQDAQFFQGWARRTDWHLVTDENGGNFAPFIQRNAKDDFVIKGESMRIGSTNFNGDSTTNFFSLESEFADPAFLEVISSGSGRGVLFGVEHAAWTWPISYTATGNGVIEVALLPHKVAGDTYNYPLSYLSAETRCFYVVAEAKKAANPIAVAGSFDFPLAARADVWAYNQSDAWHWKLVSTADMGTYFTFAGLRNPQNYVDNPVKTVYRKASAPGGPNNTWEETERLIKFIRTGAGGAYLNSWFEAMYKADKMAFSIDDGALKDRQKTTNVTAAFTKKDYFYDGSKHIFLQAVADWAFTRGETYLFDSAKNFAETVMDPAASPNVKPYGNFVPATFAAVTDAATAILEMGPNQNLEDWLRLIDFQWANIVFKQSNNFGVDTTTLGWQAPVGTPEGTDLDPDGYIVTWAAGHGTDLTKYGYMIQQWTGLKLMALSYRHFIHYAAEKDPKDPLIADLQARAPDIYHFAHRGMLDDHCKKTGPYYITDVFAGDGGNQNPDPFSPPGPFVTTCNPAGYALQSVVTFLLDMRPSESAFSYGVELHRSMADPVEDETVNDPMLNDFVYRYLVHYGLIKP